jgi:hypothetical protein
MHDLNHAATLEWRINYRLSSGCSTSMDIFDGRERAAKRLFTGAKPVTTSSDFRGAMNRDGKSNLREFTGAGVIAPVS